MKRQGLWIGAGLVALALGMRLYGIDWGLPQVYEEAYPFKKAWPMWGWGPDARLDLNPHFFNYPSLFFYVQWLGQGLLYLLLRIGGVVHSVLDYRALYVLDKTPFYIMGRTLTVLFACGTVWVTWHMTRRLHGGFVAALAGFLVAVNAFHVAKSQVIEVDVPLTFFVMLTLAFALRILAAPRRRDYLFAGLCGGLATSTKYSGLFLVLPLLAAHLLALRQAERRARPATTTRSRPARGTTARPTMQAYLAPPALMMAVFVAALFLTSPYILLDFRSFWVGFNYERQHMQIGHFGLDQSPAIVYYLRVLATSLLGWPLAIVATVALVWFMAVRRVAWAWVLCIFPVVYVAVISSFKMKADRYVLPLVPIACILASILVAAGIRALRRARPRLGAPAAVAAVLLLAVPAFVGYARGLGRLRDDTRTLARQWLETHVPAGAFVVSEAYGPEPLSAVDLANLSEDLRARIMQEIGDTKVYAMYSLPMLQVNAEYVAAFYDLRYYDGLADYIITSSSVSSRYRKEPSRFAPMLAFYDTLAAHWPLVREFGPDDGTGPRLRIHKNPRFDVVFAARRDVPSPATLPPLPEPVPGVVGPSYQRLGVNLEIFGHFEQAAASFLRAANYAEPQPNFRLSVLTSALRCYLRAGRAAEVLALLDEAERTAPAPAERAYWQDLRRQLTAEAPAP